jgi:hypothetical protein
VEPWKNGVMSNLNFSFINIYACFCVLFLIWGRYRYLQRTRKNKLFESIVEGNLNSVKKLSAGLLVDGQREVIFPEAIQRAAEAGQVDILDYFLYDKRAFPKSRSEPLCTRDAKVLHSTWFAKNRRDK